MQNPGLSKQIKRTARKKPWKYILKIISFLHPFSPSPTQNAVYHMLFYLQTTTDWRRKANKFWIQTSKTVKRGYFILKKRVASTHTVTKQQRGRLTPVHTLVFTYWPLEVTSCLMETPRPFLNQWSTFFFAINLLNCRQSTIYYGSVFRKRGRVYILKSVIFVTGLVHLYLYTIYLYIWFKSVDTIMKVV